MNRIDIVGVGGVGKSTLMKNLKAKRSNKTWLDENEALNIAARNAIKSTKASYVLIKIIFLISKTGIKLPKTVLLQVLNKMGSSQFRNFLKENPDFLRAIIKGIERQSSNNIQKLDFIHHFVHVIQKYSFIEHYSKRTNWVIWDESLTHKMFAVIPWEMDSIDLVKHYCETMPLPNGVIYLRDNPENITKKIKNRTLKGITISAHENLSTNCLTKLNSITIQLVEFSIEILKNRGINVLELNAQDKKEVNLLKAQKFVDSLIIKNK